MAFKWGTMDVATIGTGYSGQKKEGVTVKDAAAEAQVQNDGGLDQDSGSV